MNKLSKQPTHMDITVQGQGRQSQVITLPCRSPCQVNSAFLLIVDVITMCWTSMIIRHGRKSQIMQALKIRNIVVAVAISKANTIRLKDLHKTRNRLWMLHKLPNRIQHSNKALATISRQVWQTIASEWHKWTNTTLQLAVISWLWAQQKLLKALILQMIWCCSQAIAVVTNLVDVTRLRSSTPPSNTPNIKPCNKPLINKCKLLQPQLTRSWRY